MPLGPALKRIFNLSPHLFSIILSSYAIAAFASSFLSASYVDKFDRKKVLLVGYSGFIIATFACGFANSFISLLLARIIAGLFGGLIGSQVVAMVADTFAIEKRGHAMGILMGAFAAASILGIPIALYLSEYSWNTPFIVLSIISAIVLVLVVQYVPSMSSHITPYRKKRNPFSLLRLIFADKNQRRALVMNIVLMLSHFSVLSFMSPYLVTNVGFSEANLKYVYFFGGVMSLISGPIIGKMADKYGKFRVYSIFAIIAIVPILIITHLGTTPIYVALALTSCFFLVSSGRIIPSQALMSTVVEPHNRGGFMSVNSSLKQLSSGAASYFTGIVITESASGQLLNYHYVGYFGAILSIVSVWLGRRLIEKS